MVQGRGVTPYTRAVQSSSIISLEDWNLVFTTIMFTLRYGRSEMRESIETRPARTQWPRPGLSISMSDGNNSIMYILCGSRGLFSVDVRHSLG